MVWGEVIVIKVSDYVANFIAQQGIKHVFMLTGGGAMHLNESFGKHPELEVVFNHHEQASAMGAESYARLLGKPAVINVTTGPGGINAINGVFGAWTDSVPMIVISGQVRYDTTVESSGLPLRQLGDQECEIIKMVTPITKYAVMITDPQTILTHLKKAVHLATSGRPGPVWVDIPMNIQGTFIDETTLFDESDSLEQNKIASIDEAVIEKVIQALKKAERPVLLVGGGVRAGNGHEEFLALVDALKIPVVTAWNAHDLIDDENPYYMGRPGTIGNRAGNFIVQNSDLLLVLGSRLNIRQIGYNYKTFAREAFKIMVDIDPTEMIKPTLSIDLPICAHAKVFAKELSNKLKTEAIGSKTEWLDWCTYRKNKYPVVLKEYWELKEKVNPYCFMQTLSESLPENQITVTGDGTACVTSFQAMKIKKGQRLFTNSGSASMGYDLPGAIGACVASNKEKVICIAGDGSIQQNIQELATISFNEYPIKIFVLNNNGYHSIRQTQQNFFGSKLVGVGPDSGLGFPCFEKLASVYGLDYYRCDNHGHMKDIIEKTLEGNRPVICEVMLTLEQQFSPKASSMRLSDGRMVSKPLEDLAPFLSREEFASNMIIKVLEE